MGNALKEFVTTLTEGLPELASGIGSGVNGFVSDLFLKVNESGAVEGLSAFGGVVAIFGGISLALKSHWTYHAHFQLGTLDWKLIQVCKGAQHCAPSLFTKQNVKFCKKIHKFRTLDDTYIGSRHLRARVFP